MGFNMGSNSMQGLNPSRVSKQPARCQVEGCSVDLSGSKAYYARHKVCGIHSKSPMVVVGGIHQRFCQQCSRFHQLVEFDEGKRSCRRRLAGHNERRRKPPSSSLTSQIRLHSSPFPGDNSLKLRGFLMDFTCPHPSLRDSWIGGAGANSDGALSLLSAQFLWGNSLNRNSLPPRPHVTATGTTTSTTSISSDNGYCGAPIVASDVSSTSNSKSGLSSLTEPAWLSNELELGGLQRKRQCVELDGVFRSNLKH